MEMAFGIGTEGIFRTNRADTEDFFLSTTILGKKLPKIFVRGLL